LGNTRLATDVVTSGVGLLLGLASIATVRVGLHFELLLGNPRLATIVVTSGIELLLGLAAFPPARGDGSLA